MSIISKWEKQKTRQETCLLLWAGESINKKPVTFGSPEDHGLKEFSVALLSDNDGEGADICGGVLHEDRGSLWVKQGASVQELCRRAVTTVGLALKEAAVFLG